MTTNEAAERFRVWIGETGIKGEAELFDAALADERRRVIEQIREQVDLNMDEDSVEYSLVRGIIAEVEEVAAVPLADRLADVLRADPRIHELTGGRIYGPGDDLSTPERKP